MCLGKPQDLDRLFIARARIAHRVRQALHGLDILREYLQPGVDHGRDVRLDAVEVGRQGLDRRRRVLAFDFAHALRVVARAEVRQVVAIYRCYDDVF